jgi:hypothetical protein
MIWKERPVHKKKAKYKQVASPFRQTKDSREHKTIGTEWGHFLLFFPLYSTRAA